MRKAAFGFLFLGLSQLAFSDPASFEYVTWTNQAGKGFLAKLERVEEKKVILRAKKGGKRYPVKREDLSDESKARLLGYMDDVKNDLSGAPKSQVYPHGYRILKPSVVFRAMALGMGNKLQAMNAVVPCRINKIRVTDRLTATLDLEGGLFRQVQAPKGIEFFVKEKTLNSRSSTKRNWTPYYWRYGRVNEGARVLLKEGEQFRLILTPESRLEWGQVGVTEGPLIR